MTQSRSRFLAIAGAGVSVVAVPHVARAQGVKLRMAGVLSDSFGEPFFAKDAGAFARQGFDIEVSSLSNAGAIAAAIGGGSLELGIGDLISGVNAINAGVPNLLLAGSGIYSSTDPASILAVTTASPVRVPRDLNGKSIGVPTLVGLTTASLHAWLPQNGVDASTVKIVEIPPSAMFPAMERGTLDCALLGEPFIIPYKSQIRDIGHPFVRSPKVLYLGLVRVRAWISGSGQARRAAAITILLRWCKPTGLRPSGAGARRALRPPTSSRAWCARRSRPRSRRRRFSRCSTSRRSTRSSTNSSTPLR